MTLDLLQHRVRPPKGEPEGALILFHGRGADGNDLFPLIYELDPEGHFVGATPQGPLMLPPAGYHWYAFLSVGYPDPETFWPTFERVERWLDVFADSTGVPLSRTILGGFSQGAVMSYALTLKEGRPRPAGLMALSGFMPIVPGLDYDFSWVEGFRVAIGHGGYDPVIEVGFSRTAKEELEAAGADVLYRESPMQHSIDPGYLPELRKWAEETLRAAE